MTAGASLHAAPAWILCVCALLLVLSSTAAEPADAIAWEGSITLDGPFHVAQGTTLTVAPGTSVQGPGPVIVHGTIYVQGTPEQPVQWLPTLIIDHEAQAISSLRNVWVTGHGIDEPCKVQLRQGSLGLYGSRFENTTRAVCAASHTYLEAAFNHFALNGFALYPEPVGPVAVTECRNETPSETCHPHPTPDVEDTVGGRVSCWPQTGGGWACRGWGGAMAIGIDTDAIASIHNNTFHQNHVGIMTGLGAMQIAGNTFRDNDHGIQVWAQGPIIGTTGQPLLDPLVIDDNLFLDHGNPDNVSPSPGLWSALQIYGDHDKSIRPDPDDIRVLVKENTFRGGSVGVQVEGWRPSIGVANNTFLDNGIGFRGLTASAILSNNTFQNEAWDIYLDGVTGYVILRGGTIDPQKIHVGGGQSLDTDWGLIAGTTIAAVIVLLAVITEPGRYLLTLVVVPLTNRVRDKQGLYNHPRRQRILEFVQNYPGTYLRAISEALGIPRNPMTYHVQVLERAGLIHSRRLGFHRRVYPVGHDAATLEPSPRQRILDLVESRPGIQQAQAARQLGMSPQLFSHHVKSLEMAGMVQRQQEGIRKVLFPVLGGP